MSQILLRKIKEEDLEMIRKWRMQPDITKYMNTDPVLTKEDQIQWFNKIKHSDTCKSWIIQTQSVDVGVLNLMDIDTHNKRCRWGYYVAEKEYRSLRLATALEWNLYDYVFYTLGLNKLSGDVLGNNKEVVKLHEMCGSDRVGILKEHIYKNGEFYDVILIEICKSKWDKVKSNFAYEKVTFE